MIAGAEKYLRKRADLERHPIVVPPCTHVDQILVAPVYAEEDTLPLFLESVARNDARELESTLVLCVVNNPAATITPPEVLAQNERVLRWLEGNARAFRFGVGWIDASSEGRELPGRGGVGAARKAGMDCAVDLLEGSTSRRIPIIASCDADAPLSSNYLRSIRTWADIGDPWAVVAQFEHTLPDEPGHCDAIVSYEVYMRYHMLGLEWARSPYAYPAMGSIIVCTAEAYIAAGGMNRRQGGEDFYFLQELAKTGRVDAIGDAVVYPSPRTSTRVPFGTGPRVRRLLDTGEAMPAYHPAVYGILRQWLESVPALFDDVAVSPTDLADSIDPRLAEFLEGEEFDRHWKLMWRQAPSPEHRARQFHRWFDAFRTLKLIHYLRDHGLPNMPVMQALVRLCREQGVSLTMDGLDSRTPLEALQALRDHARGRTRGSVRGF